MGSKYDSAEIALLAAAAGGAFALFNQLVTKCWEALAARITRGRQARGLLASTLAEALHNADMLINLIMHLKIHLDAPEGEVWEAVARSRSQAWLGRHRVRDAEWSRFAASDVGAEFHPDAMVMLGRSYARIQNLMAEFESMIYDNLALSRDGLEYILDQAKCEVRPCLVFAMIFGCHYRGLRRSSVWFVLIQVLASLGANDETLSGIDWNFKPYRGLRKQLIKVEKAMRQPDGQPAEDAALAMKVLGLTDDTRK
jgi:hypothetical protein